MSNEQKDALGQGENPQKTGHDYNESTVPEGGTIPKPMPGPAQEYSPPQKPFKITSG